MFNAADEYLPTCFRQNPSSGTLRACTSRRLQTAVRSVVVRRMGKHVGKSGLERLSQVKQCQKIFCKCDFVDMKYGRERDY
jgi:hypothetical protein